MRVFEALNLRTRNESDVLTWTFLFVKRNSTSHRLATCFKWCWFAWEHVCWDPKDGELCLSRVKPGETLVEARSDSDVQIDRQTWVKGRKTHRTIGSWFSPKFPSG